MSRFDDPSDREVEGPLDGICYGRCDFSAKLSERVAAESDVCRWHDITERTWNDVEPHLPKLIPEQTYKHRLLYCVTNALNLWGVAQFITDVGICVGVSEVPHEVPNADWNAMLICYILTMIGNFALCAYEAYKAWPKVQSGQISYAYTDWVCNTYYSLYPEKWALLDAVSDKFTKVDKAAKLLHAKWDSKVSWLLVSFPQVAISFAYILYANEPYYVDICAKYMTAPPDGSRDQYCSRIFPEILYLNGTRSCCNYIDIKEERYTKDTFGSHGAVIFKFVLLCANYLLYILLISVVLYVRTYIAAELGTNKVGTDGYVRIRAKKKLQQLMHAHGLAPKPKPFNTNKRNKTAAPGDGKAAAAKFIAAERARRLRAAGQLAEEAPAEVDDPVVDDADANATDEEEDESGGANAPDIGQYNPLAQYFFAPERPNRPLMSPAQARIAIMSGAYPSDAPAAPAPLPASGGSDPLQLPLTFGVAYDASTTGQQPVREFGYQPPAIPTPLPFIPAPAPHPNLPPPPFVQSHTQPPTAAASQPLEFAPLPAPNPARQ